MNGQQSRIFEYLKTNKSATGLELLKHCGVMSHSKRIWELNQILPEMGYKITKTRVKVWSRIARKDVWVMEYTLSKQCKKSKKSKK